MNESEKSGGSLGEYLSAVKETWEEEIQTESRSLYKELWSWVLFFRCSTCKGNPKIEFSHDIECLACDGTGVLINEPELFIDILYETLKNYEQQ